MTYDDIRRQFGSELGNSYIDQLSQAENELRVGNTRARSLGEAAYDTGSGVAAGLANSVLAIPTLAAGAVNDRAGIFAAEQVQRLNQAIQDTQSPALNSLRNANRDRSVLDQRDTTALFEEESK
jgi:hypothetical protein